jgi:single-strand DNA-binding protein
MNQATIVGRLGQEPDFKMTQTGMAVCNISIATTRADKNKTTDWHRCVVWGKAADVVQQYCRKGDYIAVTGSIQYSEFQGKDGNMVKKTEIHCNNVSLIGATVNRGGERNAPAPSHFETTNSETDVPF